jgi:hypothetical protein
MSFGAPLSKAEQDREASIRNEASGIEPGSPRDGVPEIIGEDTPPTPIPAPTPALDQAPANENEPAEPTPVHDPRADIAKRVAERRAKEREQFIAHEVEPKPLFLEQPAANDDNASAPAVNDNNSPAPEAKTYELKVNGEKASVTREQLLAMADLSAEDAADLPDAALIKTAQITEAARRRLEAAKNTPFGTAPAPAAPAATPAAIREPQTELSPEQSANETPSLKDRLEKIQYGDPEEAEAAFEDAVDLVAAKREAANRMRQVEADQQRAIENFGQKYDDVNSHEEASQYVLTKTTAEVINDLRKLGAPEANLIPLRTNPAMAYKAHREARAAGYDVRTPTEILDVAGTAARKLFGLSQEAGQQQPSPTTLTPARINDRQAAKRALSQQPQRSGNPVATDTPAPQQSRSDAVRKARMARGQPVA